MHVTAPLGVLRLEAFLLGKGLASRLSQVLSGDIVLYSISLSSIRGEVFAQGSRLRPEEGVFTHSLPVLGLWHI